MTNEPSPNDALPSALVERVLAKLGFASRPAADMAGLARLYAAWCRKVPFDNARKLIALRAAHPGPLPGDSSRAFLEAWLADGAGGTCWAMHGAWTEVLRACGFRAERGIATMLVAPDLPPNHGTTSAQIDGKTLLVDACVQHGEPLVLDPHLETGIQHPAHGVHVRPDGGKWLLRWRSPFAPGRMDCRIDSLASDAAEFRAYHETTRGWSPFNYQLFARVHRNGGILLAVRGERVVIDASGTESRSPLAGEDRLRFLIEELELDESFARAVPQDVAMPPPPRSAAALAAGERGS
jgi:N-hydroxyarylamine O-acetyltransferase